MLRITESQARYFSNQAYIRAFNARPRAEIELDLIEHSDAIWTAADRARRAELTRRLTRGDGGSGEV